jgi:restriction endonuclease S subunit
MKQIKILIVVMTILTNIGLFSSCSKDDDIKPIPIDYTTNIVGQYTNIKQNNVSVNGTIIISQFENASNSDITKIKITIGNGHVLGVMNVDKKTFNIYSGSVTVSGGAGSISGKSLALTYYLGLDSKNFTATKI